MSGYVLIVEDDVEIRTALEEVLSVEGFNLHTVKNGREALNYLETSRELPSLILLDLMMPVMDGLEFRTEQLKEPRIAGIPTALLSADGRIDQKSQELGITHTIKKPVELDKLINFVNRYLN